MTETTRKRWYAGGLAFACKGCGQCCRGPGGFVWVDLNEVDTLAEHLRMTRDEFARRYVRRVGTRLALIDADGEDCVFLGADGKCEVYDARPHQCRNYPWWPEIVASRERWDEEGEYCPGIGQGRVHDAETIERLKSEP